MNPEESKELIKNIMDLCEGYKIPFQTIAAFLSCGVLSIILSVEKNDKNRVKHVCDDILNR